MKLEDFGSRQAERENLEAVAARITPLPSNVVPSETFVTETRLRLLQLELNLQSIATQSVAA